MDWGSPYYPAGVTDALIEEYFGDHGCCCATCEHYSGGACWKKENSLTAEEAEMMTQDEFDRYISVDTDDYCDEYDKKDDEIPDCFEDSWKEQA